MPRLLLKLITKKSLFREIIKKFGELTVDKRSIAGSSGLNHPEYSIFLIITVLRV